MTKHLNEFEKTPTAESIFNWIESNMAILQFILGIKDIVERKKVEAKEKVVSKIVPDLHTPSGGAMPITDIQNCVKLKVIALFMHCDMLNITLRLKNVLYFINE